MFIVAGQITAEEAALKVQQLSDTRAKATSKTKVKYNSPFEDDLLNGNRELQKAMRRQRIQEEKARRGGGGERVRGEQDTRCHNWRFRQDIEREEKEAAGLLEAASEARAASFLVCMALLNEQEALSFVLLVTVCVALRCSGVTITALAFFAVMLRWLAFPIFSLSCRRVSRVSRKCTRLDTTRLIQPTRAVAATQC